MRFPNAGIVAIVFLITASRADSQTFQISYGGTSGEIAQSISPTTDGGYIITGNTSSWGNSDEVYLMKIDLNGNLQWSQTYGSTASEYSRFVRQTTDGGYVVGGHTMGYGAGGSDVLFFKTSSNGTVQWAKTYGGTVTGVLSDVAWDGQLTSDGGFILVGETSNFGTGGTTDVYLLKVSSSGTLLWTKTYGNSTGTQYGHEVKEVSGGFVIAGYTGAGLNEDIYILKVSTNGTLLWTKTYGDPFSNDRAYGIITTSGGGYMVTGYYGAEAFLMKTDANGNIDWMKTYFGGTQENARRVCQTTDGGYAVAGDTYSFGFGVFDFLLFKTDNAGTVQWASATGSTDWDEGYGVIQTADGGFLVNGNSSLGAGGVGSNFLVFKTNASGASGCNEVTGTLTETVPLPSSGTLSLSGAGGGATGSPALGGNPSPGSTQSILCQVPLPLAFLSFTGHSTEQGNMLNWSASQENDYYYFAVEKSADGIDFEEAGRVKIPAVTAFSRNFSFIDTNPFTGITYYRIRQSDYDGRETFSRTISIKAGPSLSIRLTSVITEHFVDYHLSLPANSTLKIYVLGLSGNVLSEQEQHAASGTLSGKINVSNLSAGMYFLRIDDGNRQSQCRFIKN